MLKPNNRQGAANIQWNWKQNCPIPHDFHPGNRQVEHLRNHVCSHNTSDEMSSLCFHPGGAQTHTTAVAHLQPFARMCTSVRKSLTNAAANI